MLSHGSIVLSVNDASQGEQNSSKGVKYPYEYVKVVSLQMYSRKKLCKHGTHSLSHSLPHTAALSPVSSKMDSHASKHCGVANVGSKVGCDVGDYM